MKPYGLPRCDDVAHPDVADCQQYGLKSSAGNLPGKGGDIRSMHKKSASKRASRRTFKRIARRAGKAACAEE
jgi:hypothetical protein